MAEKTQRFILMPRRGVRDAVMLHPLLRPDNLQPKPLFAMSFARGAIRTRRAPAHDIRILHSIREDGLKLAEMSPESVLNLRATLPGVRVVPLVEYRTADRPRFTIAAAAKSTGRQSGGNLRLNIKAAGKGTPLAGANVIAFTDFAKGEGLDGTSNASGVASIARDRASLTVERLFVYPPNGYWGYFAEKARIKDGDTIELTAIDLATPDLVASLYGTYPGNAGSGVKVGIIDTGVARNHPDIVLAGGKNLVRAEDPADFGPSADHGTHVAGIVGARGAAPSGKRGVAPGVTLMSYRVFGHGAEKADNYAIARAIDQAVTDKCDLINMSLSGAVRDPAVEESVNAAYQAGTLSICATGNDSRQPVSFPALLQQVLAVSAFGQRGTFPAQSVETADIANPFAASNRDRFIAAFSNVGQEVALTGPGVGIVSTVPAKDYATMSGTSMACPAVTGCVAAILSQEPKLLKMPRDQKRTQAFIKAALIKAVIQGFGPTDGSMEGHGLL